VIVNVRLTALGEIAKPAQLSRWPVASASSDAPAASSRPVTFRDIGTVDTPVHLRSALPIGWRAGGPMVIEEPDSTTVVHPGWHAEIADGYNMVISSGGGSPDA
jgi:N-methylhydantoinase A